MIPLLGLLLGCPGGGPDWGVVGEQFGDGMLLSAWSNGDELLMVGGDLNGGPGVLARFDGSTLCTVSNFTDTALWWIHGSAPGDWWAVGERGLAIHVVDDVVTVDAPDTEATLFGVWVDGDEVWAVGGDVRENTGEIWRRDGSGWNLIAGDLPGTVFKVWDGWFVGAEIGYRWDGSGLIEVAVGERLLTVRGRAPDDVWAVGGTTSAAVVHSTGGDFEPFDSTSLGQPLNGVWTAPGEPVWVAGNFGTAAFWDEEVAAWSFSSPPVTSEHFHAVYKHGEDVFFIGGNLFSAGNNTGTVVRYGEGSTDVPVETCD